MAGGIFRVLLYLIVIFSPLIYLMFALPQTGENFVSELGKGFALVGAMILIMQVLLAARIKWIEKAFGFDMVIRFHGAVMIIGGVLILLHPVLLAVGHNSPQLLLSFDLPWYILLGKAALVFIFLNIIISIFQKKLKINYENWRLSHDILGPLILVLVFLHSYFVGDDIQATGLKTAWPVIFAVGASVFVWHVFIKPLLLKMKPFRVKEVKQEAEGVHTVKMVPVKFKKFSHLPGQFQFLRFFSESGVPSEEHHFTISSSPTQQDYVTSTIKEMGDFTSKISRLKNGDTAVIDAPYGRFSYTLHPEKRLVFIAGGAGITPIMSMLSHIKDTKPDVEPVLLYANKNIDSAVFRKELEKMVKGEIPGFKLVHVLGDTTGAENAEKGRIDKDLIEKYCGENIEEKGFYICGPPPMISAAVNALVLLGVKKQKIHTEIFSFI